jgi:hypothetical protein
VEGLAEPASSVQWDSTQRIKYEAVWKLKTIVIYLSSDVGSTEKDDESGTFPSLSPVGFHCL